MGLFSGRWLAVSISKFEGATLRLCESSRVVQEKEGLCAHGAGARELAGESAWEEAGRWGVATRRRDPCRWGLPQGSRNVQDSRDVWSSQVIGTEKEQDRREGKREGTEREGGRKGGERRREGRRAGVRKPRIHGLGRTGRPPTISLQAEGSKLCLSSPVAHNLIYGLFEFHWSRISHVPDGLLRPNLRLVCHFLKLPRAKNSRGQGWRGKLNWKMLHVDPELRPHHLETQPEMKSLFLTLLDPPPTIGDSHTLISSTHFSD